MPLDARLEAERLRKLYSEDPKQSSFNLLLMGETGSGKTFLVRTARKPVHVDSWDPGGTICLRSDIAKGDVVVDTSYESEDQLAPTMFEKWKRDFTERVKDKYFESFSTYVLDSSTMFSQAIMNQQLKSEARQGTAPKFTVDFYPQRVLIEIWLKRILDLPCDVIVTGHLEKIKDELVGNIEERYMTTGKAAVIVPLMFTEKWVMTTRETPTGLERKIITQRTGRYLASSSIAAGKLNTYEEPDIKAILKKCGMPTNDKQSLFGPKQKGK